MAEHFKNVLFLAGCPWTINIDYMLNFLSSEPDASPGRLVSRSDAPGCLEIIHRSLDCRDSQGACTLVEEAGRPNER